MPGGPWARHSAKDMGGEAADRLPVHPQSSLAHFPPLRTC